MPTVDKDRLIPALFFHSAKVYITMLDEAQSVQADGNVEIIVYEGKLTELITQKLYLSTPYYTAVTRALKAMGCIRQLRRGGGSSPSQWEMLHEPTVELFFEKVAPLKDESETTGADDSEAPTPPLEQLAQQMRDLSNRMLKAEESIEVLIRAFPDELVE